MTFGQAVMIAVACMVEKRRRHYAFDANLAKRMGEGVWWRGERAKEKYDEITQAIVILEGKASGGKEKDRPDAVR